MKSYRNVVCVNAERNNSVVCNLIEGECYKIDICSVILLDDGSAFVDVFYDAVGSDRDMAYVGRYNLNRFKEYQKVEPIVKRRIKARSKPEFTVKGLSGVFYLDPTTLSCDESGKWQVEVYTDETNLVPIGKYLMEHFLSA